MMKFKNDWKTRVYILILFNTAVILNQNFSGVRWNPDVKTVESTLSVSIAVWMIFEYYYFVSNSKSLAYLRGALKKN